jgi:DNA-binding PadR family transcriptional regulator
VQSRGPARRVYSLTSKGEQHLEHWAKVLETVSQSMFRLVARIHSQESYETEALIAGPGLRKTNEYKKISPDEANQGCENGGKRRVRICSMSP